MSSSVERRPFRLKKKIGKFFSKLSSKISLAFKSTDRIFLSDHDLTVPKTLKLKTKQDEIVPGSDSTMVLQSSSSLSSRQPSSLSSFRHSSLNTSYNWKSNSLASGDLIATDPYVLNIRESLESSRYSSREASRFQLSSIDEISASAPINCMSLEFNLMPIAIQPENVEEIYKAKRTKSAQSRKSLKSAPSLENLLERSQENSQILDEFDFTSCQSNMSRSFQPSELRCLLSSLRIEEKLQTNKKSKKIRWSDELNTFRTRSFSLDRIESNKRENNSSGLNRYSTQSTKFKETSSIFIRDREAIFVNRMGKEECSTTQINQYHIIREIGCGAFGTVYLSKSSLNGQYFALKMISKSRLKKKMRWKAVMNGPGQLDISEEMRREIAVLKKLSRHPNLNYLVEVLDSSYDDNIYLSRIVILILPVFELCEYGAVMKLKPNETVTPYTEDMARKMFRDVLLGLEYMHYKKIIHRDIKPENLLFSAEFSVVIGDFGISHTFENEEAAVNDTNASPAFSPPEAFHEKSGIPDGRAADVWSLGVTLYALVHGRCPFDTYDIIELAEKIKYDEIKYSSEISPLLIDLMTGMLKKNPSDRPTIAELKVHPWVTLRGSDPMISTEENCIYEEVTDEEVKTAFKPAVKLVTKIIDSLKRKLLTKRRSDGDRLCDSFNNR